MYTCTRRVTIVLASDCSSKTTGRTMTSTMALTILHNRLSTAELNSSSSHVALVRITMRLIPCTSTVRHRKSKSTTASSTREKATQRSQPLFNAEVSPSHASRASAQCVRRDCIRYFYQISDLSETAFVVISGGNPGYGTTTAAGKARRQASSQDMRFRIGVNPHGSHRPVPDNTLLYAGQSLHSQFPDYKYTKKTIPRAPASPRPPNWA